MAFMVSISGIRGVVGETLTPEIIVNYDPHTLHFAIAVILSSAEMAV